MLGRSFHQDLALSVLSRTWKMSVLLKSGTLLNVTALNTLILFRFCIKMFCMFPSKLSVIPTVSKCALLFFFLFLLVLYFFICMLHSPVVGYPFMSLISFFYCHLPNCLTIKLNTHTHWTVNLLVAYLFLSFFPLFWDNEKYIMWSVLLPWPLVPLQEILKCHLRQIARNAWRRIFIFCAKHWRFILTPVFCINMSI